MTSDEVLANHAAATREFGRRDLPVVVSAYTGRWEVGATTAGAAMGVVDCRSTGLHRRRQETDSVGDTCRSVAEVVIFGSIV